MVAKGKKGGGAVFPIFFFFFMVFFMYLSESLYPDPRQYNNKEKENFGGNLIHHTAFTRSKTKLGLSGGESGSWIFSGSSGTSGRFSGSWGTELTLSLSIRTAGLAQLSGVRRLDGDACADGLASKAFGASLIKQQRIFLCTDAELGVVQNSVADPVSRMNIPDHISKSL